MTAFSPQDFGRLYADFDSPIAEFDCGDRCAPYNERGVPFCCDTRHAVPTAYLEEWEFLQTSTNLWHRWEGRTPAETSRLASLAPEGQVLIACLGHRYCQREFRSLACRAFPFYPYINRKGELIGLGYFWEYEDRCWVISNLQVVSQEFLRQFIRTFELIFERMPEERDAYLSFSEMVRRTFRRKGRAILLLHRNGNFYKVTPTHERLRRIPPEKLPKYGDYKVAAQLPFPDEIEPG